LSQRIYRDPVHNIIPLREDTAEGRLMVQLVDAVEFQRLRRIKQLGLGLYTCREVITASGGSIKAESVEGAGTTFRVVLPSIPHDRRN